MSTPIAIVILTKDEPEFLEQTVHAIVGRTNYPYELFIVDNHSNSNKQKILLNKYKREGVIQVIFNNKNQWILGFNKAIDIINNSSDLSSEYTVLTDGDIVVPEPVDGVCWLTYLKQKMDANVMVGKLGLALATEFIQANEKFAKTYERELKYMNGSIVDGLIIGPVDTTLAIYRKNLFVMNQFKMLPGHASLIKPYYYICRTNYTYQAEHLGWGNYDNPDKVQINEKVVCFTKYVGYIDPIILSETSDRVRAFHKAFRHIYKAYWFFRVAFYWVLYIVPKFPRNLNETQSKYR